MGVSSVGFRNFSNGVASKFMTERKLKGEAATEEEDPDVSHGCPRRVEPRGLHGQCDRGGRFVFQPIAIREQPFVTPSLHLAALRWNDGAHRLLRVLQVDSKLARKLQPDLDRGTQLLKEL